MFRSNLMFKFKELNSLGTHVCSAAVLLDLWSFVEKTC